MRVPFVCSCLLFVSVVVGQTAPQPASQSSQEKPTPAKAWSILDSALKDKSADKRAKAVHALGLIAKDAKAIKLAQAALSDPQAIVRTSAATSLGKLHAKSSLPALRQALEDKETEVVFAAADALTEMDDPAAYQLYYGVLTGQRKSGHGLLVDQARTLKDRKHLAQMGFERGLGAVPFGGWGYTAFQAIHQDDVSPVRAEAAEALASDPDPRSGEALVAAAHDKSWIVRASALNAISKRADAKLLPRISDLLTDQKDAVQYAAAATFIRLSNVGGRKPAASVQKRE
jgi:HEAT repeat protein